jgi:hypothetical protein
MSSLCTPRGEESSLTAFGFAVTPRDAPVATWVSVIAKNWKLGRPEFDGSFRVLPAEDTTSVPEFTDICVFRAEACAGRRVAGPIDERKIIGCF